MKVVARLVVAKYLKMLKQADSLESAALAEAKDRLVSYGDGVIPLVLELLDDEVARAPAMDVLTSLLSNKNLATYVEALSSENKAIVSGVTEVLSSNKRYEAGKLLDHLEDTDHTSARLDPVLQARGAAIPPERVIARFTSAGADSRAVLFRVLETHGKASMTDHCLKLLDNEDWWLRAKAMKLLARFPSEAGVAGVTRLLRDSNRKVRIEAVHALGALKDPSSIPALCEALRDNDLKVHTAAIDALISINDVAAVPHLIKILTDESEFARRGAVEVLNEVATQEAIEDLVRALGDEDWWVRVRAADALGTLGGDRVVKAILSLMASSDVFIRRYAVEILYAVPNETAVDELIKALSDEDWWVRERSIDALGKIGDPRAVDPLLEMMSRDPEVQVLCVRALGVLGDQRAVGPLCDLFHSENQELNREVREALISFSKQADITSENRGRIRGLLGDQRVREQNSSIMPLDVRKGKLAMDPEFGRSRVPTPLPPRRAGSESGAGKVESPQTAPAASDSKSYPTLQAPDLSHQDEKQKVPAALASGADLDPDTVLVNRYRVLRKIGDGGFGTVYLVKDLEVDDELILKILRPQISVDETMIQRFVHELKYTRQIAHKNVIRIYDFLKLGQAHAISMEYFPGTDLSTILEKEGRLSPARSLCIARQICGGLHAAHSEGIIHRDVKPPNIQIGEGDTVKILDFGLASMMQYAGSRLTKSGILIGTPQYMSPEQITGEKIDARSDIYSLGVMMYEMLSGELPVQGDNAVNILFNHLEGEITPLKERVEEIPEELEQLVMKAMARKVEERPESAAALLEMLEAVAV